MKSFTAFLFLLFIMGCDKNKEQSEVKITPVVCGTYHINSCCGNGFKYVLGSSLTSLDKTITSDTTIDIYENQTYRLHYNDTTYTSIDSVWFKPAGASSHDSVFVGIDTTWVRKTIQRVTTTGPQNFEDILPASILQ